MEPHIAVITRHSVSRPAALLREAGYYVTKVTPEHADQCADVEALVVDLRLFDLLHWMEQQPACDNLLVIAPKVKLRADISARVVATSDIEEDLISTVDRIVTDRRTANHHKRMTLVA